MNVELKPCPYCGGTVKVEWYQNNVGHVVCNKCQKKWAHQVKDFSERNELIAQKWNRIGRSEKRRGG